MSETTTDPIIVVEDLHKSFGSNEVLKGISTTVNRGEVVARGNRSQIDSDDVRRHLSV